MRGAGQAAAGRVPGVLRRGVRAIVPGCCPRWRTERRCAARPQARSARRWRGGRHRVSDAHGSSRPPRPGADRPPAWSERKGRQTRRSRRRAGTRGRSRAAPGHDAAAVGRVAVERGRRHVRAPGPLVAHHDPEPSGPGLAQARGQHRHGGVVGVQRGAGPDVAADRLGQGREQERGLPDPVGQRRAVEVHAFAAIDDGLAVERQVVAVLGHQHMGDQPRPWPTALDRQGRHWLLGNRLAGPAAQLRPDVADHLEARRHVFEHLALVLPHPAEHGAAAARASAGRLVDDRLARQVRRQRLADRLLALARPSLGLRPGRVGRAGAGVATGLPSTATPCFASTNGAVARSLRSPRYSCSSSSAAKNAL